MSMQIFLDYGTTRMIRIPYVSNRELDTLGESPVSWNSKLQTEVALSTTEAEYVALSQAMREFIPLCRLLLHYAKKAGLVE